MDWPDATRSFGGCKFGVVTGVWEGGEGGASSLSASRSGALDPFFFLFLFFAFLFFLLLFPFKLIAVLVPGLLVDRWA